MAEKVQTEAFYFADGKNTKLKKTKNKNVPRKQKLIPSDF